MMQTRYDPARFDAWLSTFETTIDGRGKLGSLVGASEEVRSLRGREKGLMKAAANGGLVMDDSSLNEYAVSSHWRISSARLPLRRSFADIPFSPAGFPLAGYAMPLTTSSILF